MDQDSYIEREEHILELAHNIAQKYKVPISTLLRIGHNTERAILETSRERKV